MDREAAQALLWRWMGMLSDARVVALVALADEVGLFKTLAGGERLTAAEVAEQAGVHPRYAEEILSGLAVGRVVEFEAGCFRLTPEQAALFAEEENLYFMAAHAQSLRVDLSVFSKLADRVREGGGLSAADYGPDLVRHGSRLNGPAHRILLPGKWLGAVLGLPERLAAGIDVADVGCGSGVSTLAMARRYPDSRFVGYDILAEGVAAAAREGLDLPNARFEVLSIMELPAASFDFILCFDVLHDLSDPLSALNSIRGSLNPGGQVLIVEPSASSSLEANLDHPLGALFYGISTFYCLPNSMAGGGSGFGTAWGRERAEEAVREAGFRSFEMLGIPNPFNAFYLVS